MQNILFYFCSLPPNKIYFFYEYNDASRKKNVYAYYNILLLYVNGFGKGIKFFWGGGMHFALSKSPPQLYSIHLYGYIGITVYNTSYKIRITMNNISYNIFYYLLKNGIRLFSQCRYLI